MESATSYYDWQQAFKKSPKSKKNQSLKNLIGISEEFFRDYMIKWKKKNLE